MEEHDVGYVKNARGKRLGIVQGAICISVLTTKVIVEKSATVNTF
jgi:hypothetical protein